MNHDSSQGIATIVVVVGVLALIVAGGVAAYFITDGFGSNKPVESTDAQDVEDDNRPTESSSTTKEMPENMPADMPVYQPSTILSSTNREGGGFLLDLNTTDSEEEVINWYKSELENTGWQLSEARALSGMLNVKKDGFSGSVTIIESDATDTGTTISYRINPVN